MDFSFHLDAPQYTRFDRDGRFPVVAHFRIGATKWGGKPPMPKEGGWGGINVEGFLTSISRTAPTSGTSLGSVEHFKIAVEKIVFPSKVDKVNTEPIKPTGK
jgi:hypothetical protein